MLSDQRLTLSFAAEPKSVLVWRWEQCPAGGPSLDPAGEGGDTLAAA